MEDLDEIAVAVKAYRSAMCTPTGQCAGKVTAVENLEAKWREPEARAFLLAVLRDQREYDLARIEICKILRAQGLTHESDAPDWAAALLRVLEGDEDDVMRQWAALAPLSACVHVPSVPARLVSFAVDLDEDVDVRHNALASLERATLAARDQAALRLAESDPEIGPAVRRYCERAPSR